MPENPVQRSLLRMIGGMFIGLLIATALAKSGALYEVATWAPGEIASTILAGLLLMVALITGGFSTSKKGYRALTDEGLGEPVEPETLSTLRRQALVTALCGLLLIVPPAAAHLGLTGASAAVALGVMAVLLAAMFWINLGLSRESDELTRAVSAEASAWTLGVAFLALFGWSALEKLALVPAISSWTLLTAGTALSFVVWMVVSLRRGLVGSR